MNEIIIILGLILLNGILSMTEIAMVSARKSSLSWASSSRSWTKTMPESTNLWSAETDPTYYTLNLSVRKSQPTPS